MSNKIPSSNIKVRESELVIGLPVYLRRQAQAGILAFNCHWDFGIQLSLGFWHLTLLGYWILVIIISQK